MGPPGHPLAGAGFFETKVVNDSSSAATVSLQFFLNATIVHETYLFELACGTTTVIAGPERASLLVGNAVSTNGMRYPEQRFVFGTDMDEETPAVFRIEDPMIEPPQQPDADTTGVTDVDTSGTEDEEEEEEESGGGGGGGVSPPDCNANGVDDRDEVSQGSAPDCNLDGVPDECQLDADCNTDGVPDECQLVPDCNSNAVPDDCDIAGGTSADCDKNDTPDECQDLAEACPGVDIFLLVDPNAYAIGVSEGLCDILALLADLVDYDTPVVVKGFMVPVYLHGDQDRLDEILGSCPGATSSTVYDDLNGPETGPHSTPAIEGDADGCPGTIVGTEPGSPGSDKNWGPATTVIATEFTGWTEGYARAIVPIIAEGPCLGGTNGLCDEGDGGALGAAMDAAQAEGVVIAPILTSNAADCLKAMLTINNIAYVTTTDDTPAQTLMTNILPCCVKKSRYSCALKRSTNNPCYENPAGPYETLEECLAECVVPMGFTCDTGDGYNCIEEPYGEYATLDECEAVCVPPPRYTCFTTNGYYCAEEPYGDYDSLSVCEEECVEPTRYTCLSLNGFHCDEDTDGEFSSLAACADSCFGSGMFTCVDGECHEDESEGPFSSLEECQQECTPPDSWECDRTSGYCYATTDGQYATYEECAAYCPVP